jgi:heme-degrading monooxygenase HmoA
MIRDRIAGETAWEGAMATTFVKYTIKPNKVDTFIRLKTVEGALEEGAPGFVKRWFVQSRTDPTTFYYLVHWETPEAKQAFNATQAWLDASGATGFTIQDVETVDLVDVEELGFQLGTNRQVVVTE